MNNNKEMPTLVWGEDNDYGTLEIVLKAFPDYHLRVAIDNGKPLPVKFHGDGAYEDDYVWWLSFDGEDKATSVMPIDPDRITQVVIY